MSATPSQEFPVLAQAAKSNSGVSPLDSRSSPAELDPTDDQMWSPPPLPGDPATLAEIHEMLEQGLQDARAGRGEDWETVHARLFGQLD